MGTRPSLLRLDAPVRPYDCGSASAFPDLLGTPAHDLATALAGRLEPLLGERLPDPEVLFLALPAAGMRIVVDDGPTGVWPTAVVAGELVSRILERITDEMVPYFPLGVFKNNENL